MPSANGYKLEVQGHTLTAAWPAPFFALYVDGWGDDDPMLVHCDDFSHALRHAKLGARILGPSFEDEALASL